MRKIGNMALPSSPRAACAALALASAWCWAEPTLTQSADAERMGLEDSLQVTISVSGQSDDDRLELPHSEDFDVLGTSRGTRLEISQSGSRGMQASRVQQVVLTLRARRTGTLTLPGATLKTEQGEIRAKPLSVVVVPGRTQAQRGRSRGGFPPMPGTNVVGDARAGATVLLEHPTRKTASAELVPCRRPGTKSAARPIAAGTRMGRRRGFMA